MRSLRWLLLVVIAVIAAGVFQVYRLQRSAGKAARRPAPPMMALSNKSDSLDWEWGQSADGHPHLKIVAKHEVLSADSKTADLSDIELRIYQKNGKFYNRVRTAHAQFSLPDQKLYAPEEAEITLDVPVEGQPKQALTSIRAARINYDSASGAAFTDQHVTFVFAEGTGVSQGASYNPQSHEIHLWHGVTLNLKGKTPKGRAMKVESDDLLYNDAQSTIVLGPRSKLTRENTVLNAGTSTVHLVKKKLESIEAPDAKGTDKQQGRDLDYHADMVHAYYNEHGEMEKLEATGNARLVSRAKAAETTMTGDRLNLFFTAGPADSVLSSVQARGNAVMEEKPVTDPKGLTPDTKNLRADSVDIFMKPDGRELDRVATLTPGTMQFLPNQATRSQRQVKGDRMLVKYGDKNQIQSFHADIASTITHPSEQEVKLKKKAAAELATTSSNTMDAVFDEKGLLKQILQAGNFHYAEGLRKAQADTATMDNAKNVMDLDTRARVADDTGSTAASHIQIDQTTGDFDARGKVEMTHLPEQKPAAPATNATTTGKDQSAMLDPGEAMDGKADHVVSSSHGKIVHYIDNAVVWQGASRIWGDTIDIDRDRKTLVATGHVVSQLQDSVPASAPAATTAASKPAAPVMTLIRAQKLVYTDTNRLAVYTGGVTLLRSLLTVKSESLQAYMNDGKPVNGKTPDSRIDHALADGKVEIAQASPKRQRSGTSEHADYIPNDGQIILTGGRPHIKDSKAGDSTGDKLTYYTDEDRLVNEAGPKKPVEGHINRGKT